MGEINGCAATPLTVRCSSALGLSYDPRQHLSTSGALNMEH